MHARRPPARLYTRAPARPPAICAGRPAAGASRVSVNLVLAVLVCSLLLYIYKTVRDGDFRIPHL